MSITKFRPNSQYPKMLSCAILHTQKYAELPEEIMGLAENNANYFCTYYSEKISVLLLLILLPQHKCCKFSYSRKLILYYPSVIFCPVHSQCEADQNIIPQVKAFSQVLIPNKS